MLGEYVYIYESDNKASTPTRIPSALNGCNPRIFMSDETLYDTSG